MVLHIVSVIKQHILHNPSYKGTFLNKQFTDTVNVNVLVIVAVNESQGAQSLFSLGTP